LIIKQKPQGTQKQDSETNKARKRKGEERTPLTQSQPFPTEPNQPSLVERRKKKMKVKTQQKELRK
jgi:hypothetical protein